MRGFRIIALALCLCSMTAQPGLATAGLPTFKQVRDTFRPSDRSLLDRRGRVLHETRTDPTLRRFAWVELDDVSGTLKDAVVASEDRRFFSHGGVDLRAALLAAAAWLSGGTKRGASTITMQLVALLDEDLRRGGRARRLGMKWRQMRAAWQLEAEWSKSQILGAYLNLVTFRGEVQGVGAASGILFGKSPHALTRAEAAVMASLIRSPNASEAAITRRARSLVVSLGVAVPIAAIDNAVTCATDAHTAPLAHVTLAPHVARRLLPPGCAIDRVRSTLDLDLQRAAVSAVRRNLLALRDHGVRDGAVLVVDNTSGDVLAYVGSSGDLSSSAHVDGVQARRQPGSTLKPFLYSLAIERELLTAASLLDDAPLEIPVATGLYRPENYDGQFRGLVSVRTALAGSLNIPAVRALQMIGEDVFVKHLRELGFAGVTHSGSYYGPALALGSAEVSLWEIVEAYRTLANAGSAGRLRLIADGPAPPARNVYAGETAFITADILADRDGRSVTFGLESALATPFWTAVKTGTSKDMRDNWCVGFSQRYTVGVWVGNFSGYPMGDVSGVSGAAPVWLEIMQWLHRDEPSRAPEPPDGVVRRDVSFAAASEMPKQEWFRRATMPVFDQSLALHRARVVAPTDATIIALDPEIPMSHQRVTFEAAANAESLTWVLNGTSLGSAARRILWPPVVGLHRLALVDASGRRIDQVSFRVRGNTPQEPAS